MLPLILGGSDLGGTSNPVAANDLGSVGGSISLDYSGTGGGDSTIDGGTATVVGYLEGSGSVLQTYSYGG